MGLVRRPAGRWAVGAGWAAGVGLASVVVGVLAGAAPMVLFGVLGVVLSVVAFLTWPVMVIFALLVARPAFDRSGEVFTVGPINILGAIGVAIVVGGSTLLFVRGHRLSLPAVTFPFTAFLALGFVTISYAPVPMEALGLWVQLTSLFLLFCLSAMLFRRPEELRRLVAVVLGAGAIPIVVAIFQLATGTSLESAGKGGASAAPGTIGHPNGLGFLLVLVLSIGLVAAFERPSRRWRVPLALLLGLGFVAFMGTYTRSAWVGLAGTLVLLATVQYRRLALFGGVALVALSIALPSTVSQVEERFADLSPSSASYSANSLGWRLDNWSRMLPYAQERPLTGHGLGSYLPLTDEEFGKFDYDFQVPGKRAGEQVVPAHNDYLFLAVEIGVLGPLLWLAVYAGLAWTMWRARACPAVRPHATAMLGVVLAFAVGSAVDNVVLYTVVILPLMAVCGAIAGVHQQWKQELHGRAS